MADPVETAADYADALVVCRRAARWLVGILLLLLGGQIVLFFVGRYGAGALPGEGQEGVTRLQMVLEYLVSLSSFGGVALVLILALVLLLVVKIMLIGRLVGVARLTSAYIWCIVLGVLLFPWQAFLSYLDLTGATFRIPGVLYTWRELVEGARFGGEPAVRMVTGWARFVVFPVVAIGLLVLIALKARRGLKQAMGELPAATGADREERGGGDETIPVQ